MKLSSLKEIDYSMLSSYLGSAATIVIFSAIIFLALGSVFIRGEDTAHSPIDIGICAFDSARVWYTFDAFSSFIIARGGGDVRWIYFAEDEGVSGCDLYLMTSLQAARYLRDKKMKCVLIVAREDGKRYSHGLVISAKDAVPEKKEARVIFGSPISASSFAASYEALEEEGIIGTDNSARMSFADSFSGAEKVYYGVLYKAFNIGCISEWEFDLLAASGLIDTNMVDVVLRSKPVIELVVTADEDGDSKKIQRFVNKLLEIYSDLPTTLEAQLTSIGISQFIRVRDADRKQIEALSAPLIIEN